VNPNQGFVPKEFSFLFKKFNLQLLKFFNEVKSVFAIDIGIEKNSFPITLTHSSDSGSSSFVDILQCFLYSCDVPRF
jgi:hypothetical protein